MKLNRTTTMILASLALGTLAALALPGCGGPTLRDFCQQSCECLTESACDSADLEGQVDECVDGFEQVRAMEGGRCAGEFDALWKCTYAADQCPLTEELCAEEKATFQDCTAQ